MFIFLSVADSWLDSTSVLVAELEIAEHNVDCSLSVDPSVLQDNTRIHTVVAIEGKAG